MTQDELKTLVGQAALQYVVPGELVGVGTGSTVNKFIDALASMKDQIKGAVSSSVASTERLRRWASRCLTATTWRSCRSISTAPTRSTTPGLHDQGRRRGAHARKDRGGAVAPLCLHCRRVQAGGRAGRFPLPVEVIPMATQRITRQFAALGGTATVRLKDGKPLVTDNGQHILDVTGLQITTRWRLSPT
jgi:ribose 5-phosphate isomerase A